MRLVPLYDVMRDDAVDQTASQMLMFMPLVPGRKWVVRRFVALVVALVERYAPQDPDTSPLVPLHLVRRGRFGRSGDVRGGVVAALLLAAVPSVTEVLVQTAQVRQVPVVRPPGR